MLIQKPHTWLEINKTAFDHNMAQYRSLVGQATRIAVVVKSNGYGHGTKEMGLLCQQNPLVEWICTASLTEALELRSYGIQKPILVLSMVDEDPRLAIQHEIDLPVFDSETAHIYHRIAQEVGKSCRIHIKIDTGLTRYGLPVASAMPTVQEIYALPHLTVVGIFTSCAESGNTDRSFTMQQMTLFSEFCKNLESLGIDIPLKHGANSAAASTVHTLFPVLNLVRLGAGAYGLWHFKDSFDQAALNHPGLALQHIATWKSRITYIKHVPTGTPVGYDRTYTTTRPTTIAIIPVGYQDGYDRRLSNKGLVLIRDYYARVIGRICMNATLIEIPADKHAVLGDQVILLGDYEHLRAHDIARTIESYNAREITTRLAPAMHKKIVAQELVNAQQKSDTRIQKMPI
jgi:alanine racemase